MTTHTRPAVAGCRHAFTDKTITMPTPCVIWTGALNSKGYPCFAVDGVSKLAHRLRIYRREYYARRKAS